MIGRPHSFAGAVAVVAARSHVMPESFGYGAPMRKVVRLAATTVTVAAGLGLAGLGTAASAQADDPPWPFEGYHWCPGQPFDPRWGPNWDPHTCHDAHHRDMDGTIHNGDYYGPGEPGPQGP